MKILSINSFYTMFALHLETLDASSSIRGTFGASTRTHK